MAKVEDLRGLHGEFNGTLREHPDPKFRLRAVADGKVTYERTVNGETRTETVTINGIRVRRFKNSPDSDVFDFRRYIKITRGGKDNKDKIIALIDKH